MESNEKKFLSINIFGSLECFKGININNFKEVKNIFLKSDINIGSLNFLIDDNLKNNISETESDFVSSFEEIKFLKDIKITHLFVSNSILYKYDVINFQNTLENLLNLNIKPVYGDFILDINNFKIEFNNITNSNNLKPFSKFYISQNFLKPVLSDCDLNICYINWNKETLIDENVSKMIILKNIGYDLVLGSDYNYKIYNTTTETFPSIKIVNYNLGCLISKYNTQQNKYGKIINIVLSKTEKDFKIESIIEYKLIIEENNNIFIKDIEYLID